MNKDASRVIGWDLAKPGSDMTMYCIREDKNIRFLTPEQFKKFKRTLAWRKPKAQARERREGIMTHTPNTNLDDIDPYELEEPIKNIWICQSCGHRFFYQWPKNREKYYLNPKPKICPNCKSEDAMPQGF